MMQVHPFQNAGLGKAPFHCTHVVDSWSACQFCGTAIRYQYWIKGSDGSHFFVGSDCVAKTGGADYVDNFKNVKSAHLKAKRDAQRQARYEARKAKWAAELETRKAAFTAENPGLYEKMQALGENSRFFADLVWSVNRYGSLTQRQLEAALRIIKERETQAQPQKVAGDLTGLATMFRKAREHLKYPKLTVNVDNGSYTFSLAGDASKNPGYIYVKRGQTYLGKVSPTGELTQSRDATPADLLAVNRFSMDPVGVAANHGHVSGNCCFCSKKLTDARSVSVGYGATCAQHYGLPWGEVTELAVEGVA